MIRRWVNSAFADQALTPPDSKIFGVILKFYSSFIAFALFWPADPNTDLIGFFVPLFLFRFLPFAVKFKIVDPPHAQSLPFHVLINSLNEVVPVLTTLLPLIWAATE